MTTTRTITTSSEVMKVEFTFDSPSDYSIRHIMPGGIKADLTDTVRTCKINNIDGLIEEFIIWLECDGDDVSIETDGGDSPSTEDAAIADAVASIMDWHESRYNGIDPDSEWNGWDTTHEGNPLEIVNHVLSEMPEILERLGFDRPEWVEFEDGLYSSNSIDSNILNSVFIDEYNRRLYDENDYYDVRGIAPSPVLS